MHLLACGQGFTCDTASKCFSPDSSRGLGVRVVGVRESEVSLGSARGTAPGDCPPAVPPRWDRWSCRFSASIQIPSWYSLDSTSSPEQRPARSRQVPGTACRGLVDPSNTYAVIRRNLEWE